MPALADTSPTGDPGQGSSHATSRDPLNHYTRPPVPRGQRPPNDILSNHAPYDSSSPNNFIPQYSQPAYFERVFPLVSHPSSAQAQNAPLGPPPTVFSYFSVPSQGSAGSWQTHVSMVQHNSYPPQSVPPSQPVHKVWILDCKSCGTFLTNRGMKAVLLLRPNVSLFSTDALPVNCSAYTTNPDALRPPPCRPSIMASPPRTCECLTQTLCCHTCGTAVGYMIVIPCSRCTSSITATNRATNGHRFVFHSNEILASERYHIPDEPGVIPTEFTPPVAPPPLTSAYLAQSPVDDPAGYRRNPHSFTSQTYPSPALGRSSPPTPLSEYGDLGPASFPPSPDPYFFAISASPRRSPRELPPSPSPRTSASHLTQSSSQSTQSSQPDTRVSTPESRGMPVEFRDSPMRKLKAGDTLYWHHLAKNGEIPGVQEDPRARVPKQKSGPKFSDR